MYVFQGFHCYLYLFFCLFMYLYTFISTFQFRDKFSVSTFQREFKFHSEKAMQGYLFVCLWCLYFLYLFMNTYIHLQVNILKPSQCLQSIPRQVFCINFSRRIQILLYYKAMQCYLFLYFYYSHYYLYVFIHLIIHLYTIIWTF